MQEHFKIRNRCYYLDFLFHLLQETPDALMLFICVPECRYRIQCIHGQICVQNDEIMWSALHQL